MKILRLFLLATLLSTSLLPAQNEAEVTALLKRLKSPDVETRHKAMVDLQESLDSRIPDACLPSCSKRAIRSAGSPRVPLAAAGIRFRRNACQY